MGRDCSKHKKGGLNKMPCLSSVVNPLFPSPLYPSSQTDDVFLWWHLKVALSTHRALPRPGPYTHTHTGVRGKSIHSCQPAAPPFTWCPIMNGPWIQAWNLSQQSMTHTHAAIHFSKMPSVFAAVAYHTCSNCQIVRLCDSVEEFLIMAAIVCVLLFGGAGVESLLTVA